MPRRPFRVAYQYPDQKAGRSVCTNLSTAQQQAQRVARSEGTATVLYVAQDGTETTVGAFGPQVRHALALADPAAPATSILRCACGWDERADPAFDSARFHLGYADVCDMCAGDGSVAARAGGVTTCPICEGTGMGGGTYRDVDISGVRSAIQVLRGQE